MTYQYDHNSKLTLLITGNIYIFWVPKAGPGSCPNPVIVSKLIQNPARAPSKTPFAPLSPSLCLSSLAVDHEKLFLLPSSPPLSLSPREINGVGGWGRWIGRGFRRRGRERPHREGSRRPGRPARGSRSFETCQPPIFVPSQRGTLLAYLPT